MWSSILFAGCLWLVSAGLALVHGLTWRSARRLAATEGDIAFRRRQYLRRMQISILIALVGCAVVATLWIESPLWEAIVWGALVLAALWIVLLAFVDALQAHRHFGEASRQNRRQYEMEVQRLLDKLRSKKNGQA